MKTASGLALAALAASASAAPHNVWHKPSGTAVDARSPKAVAAAATPTIYMCGDSTMAKGGGGSGTQGTALS